jgi:nicotinamide-nucleotide amidase
MANGALRRTGATYAIAITGNAGPTTDGDESPAGAFFVAVGNAQDIQVAHRVWPAPDRVRVRAFAAQMALDLLNRRLSQN